MATIAEALARAAQHYQAGQLAPAEQLCRQILQADPAQAKALHLLGLVAHRVGRWDEAIGCYNQALRLHPGLADIHNSLGAALAARGQFVEALASFEEALRQRPDYPEAHDNLGTAFKLLGRPGEAEASYRRALHLRPDFAQAHHDLGVVLALQNRLAEAVASFQEALRYRPDYLEALMKLADLQKQMSQGEDAEAHYRAALYLRPDLPELHYGMGAVLTERGEFAAALGSMREALRLRPDFAAAHHKLGFVFKHMGRLAEAESSYREALRCDPASPQHHNTLGLFLVEQSRWDEAVASFQEALRHRPDYAEALNNLGKCYREQGCLDEALACLRRAAELRPDLYSDLLLTLHLAATYDPEATFAEHRRWAEQFLAGVPPLGGSGPNTASRRDSNTNRDPDRRLRLGYVSGDFREHVLGRYSAAVIAAHDRGQFEVFCYANVRREDTLTERISASADHWRSLVGLSDAQAVQLILADQIDLLIDLAGHIAYNRLGVFAQKPAPVQVTHYGYPHSTGLAAIDYRLTDSYCDPPGRTERFHCEKLERLPEASWCYVPGPSPEVGPLPAHEAGAVTFACLGTLAKVTEPMIGLWAQILQALPRARMVLRTGAGSAGDERVRAAFARHGVEKDRVTLAPKLSTEAYYRRFYEADICLDTYPYTGHTTTADALWMGVPVVTLAGPTCVTRLGVSTLVLAGLEDLVTESPAAYVETAIRLARDLPRLRALRGQLRDRVKSTLGDVERFTRQLEAAYREMWQTYCVSNDW